MRAALRNKRIEGCFDAAADNLLCINTVPCDHAVYNSTGLLKGKRMFRAGGEYDTPWTRDAAVNTWNAGRFLAPQVARDTLLAVCTPDENGLPIIQPDNQKWDRVVWIIGAWQYWLATGDDEFLALARGITERSLAQLKKERYVEEFGLYRGGWQLGGDGCTGHLWHSCTAQTWSATGYLGAVISGIFGTTIERMTLDGAAVRSPIPYGSGRQALEIWLRR